MEKEIPRKNEELRPEKRRKRSFLAYVPWMISAGFVLFVLSRFNEYELVVDALSRSKWWWILLAMISQMAFFVMFSLTHTIAFKLVGINWRNRELVPVVFAALFANVLTPSGGLAGSAIFIREGRRRKYGGLRILVGYMIETIFQQASLVVVSSLFLVYMNMTQGEFPLIELYVTVGMGIVVLVQIIVFSLIRISPRTFKFVLSIVSTIANRVSKIIRKKTIVSEVWSERGSLEVRDVIGGAVAQWRIWPKLFVLTLISQMFAISTFIFLFWAYGEVLSIPAVVAGYLTGSVSGAILMGPQSIGVAEAGVALILNHYGAGAGAAALISISYRLFSFWIPLIIGFVSFRRLNLFGENGEGC